MELLTILLNAAAEDGTLKTANLFDKTTLSSLAGASMAVYIICGVTQSVFNYNPKWLAFLLSVLLSLLGAYINDTNDQLLVKIVLAILNACLIYASATGTNTIVANGVPNPGPAPASNLKVQIIPAPEKRKFFTGWFN